MSVPPDSEYDGREECEIAECEEERVEGRVELRVGRGRLLARPSAVPGEALAGRKPANDKAGNLNFVIISLALIS